MRSNRRQRRSRRKHGFTAGEDVNPMSYLSNLSDVMLILAVGIMLALILHWEVQITDTGAVNEEPQEDQNSVSFSQDDLESMDKMPEDAQQMGSVYYDSVTGKYYYIIDNDK